MGLWSIASQNPPSNCFSRLVQSQISSNRGTSDSKSYFSNSSWPTKCNLCVLIFYWKLSPAIFYLKRLYPSDSIFKAIEIFSPFVRTAYPCSFCSWRDVCIKPPNLLINSQTMLAYSQMHYLQMFKFNLIFSNDRISAEFHNSCLHVQLTFDGSQSADHTFIYLFIYLKTLHEHYIYSER